MKLPKSKQLSSPSDQSELQNRRVVESVIMTGKVPKMQKNTDGIAGFGLKISRQTLYDLGVICEKMYPPKSTREREKTKEELMVETIEKMVKTVKKKHPEYWESGNNNETQDVQ